MTDYRTKQIKGEVRGGSRYTKYPRQQAGAPAKAQQQVREVRSASKHERQRGLAYTTYDFVLQKIKKNKLRPKNTDTYHKNSQEHGSGVPASRSRRKRDLGFRIPREKMEKD